jgi:hypothetical protein
MQFAHASPVWLIWLAGLLGVWAALLFGGFAFGRLNAEGTRHMPTWTRIGSSLILALAAWSILLALWLVGASIGPMTVAALVALGMTLGLLGDLVLAHALPLPNPTLAGMAAFGLGHVSYIAALVALGDELRIGMSAARVVALALWLMVGALGWYLVVLSGHRPTALHWAALPYALLLAGMAGVATGLALQSPTLVAVAVGGVLFLLSDLILAAQLFNQVSFPLIGDVIWLTYGPAQALIVYGIALAILTLT